ncbi:MAG: HesA/MoeB/ThiF family protein [Candidatus Helarchaeota archaeon]
MNFFHRQKIIPQWNQTSFDKKILIVGIGGMGCHMAVSCCRLGVRDIVLVDSDVIEPSNLNRQTLYNKKSIGMKKTEAAKNNLEYLHKINSNIEVVDIDIFKEWKQFIPLVKDSDFVLNGLDCPEIKRVAVSSICLKYEKPMIYAGTDVISGNAGVILYQPSKGKPCYECLQAALVSIEPKYYKIFKPNNIDKQDEIPIDAISREYNPPVAASTNYTAATISNLAINLLVHFLLNWSVLPNRIIIDMYNLNIESWNIEGAEECPLCGNTTE